MPAQVYKRVPIDSIHPHPENPNQGDLEAIEESVEENGWYGACIVQKSSRAILVGNHRWQVWKERGETHIDAFLLDCDDDRALRIMLADNRTARRARMDGAKEKAILEHLRSVDGELRGTGYDLDWLRQVEEGTIHPDQVAVPEYDEWEQRYGVIVEVESEQEQEVVFETLTEMGMTCRVVTA